MLKMISKFVPITIFSIFYVVAIGGMMWYFGFHVSHVIGSYPREIDWPATIVINLAGSFFPLAVLVFIAKWWRDDWRSARMTVQNAET